MSTHSHLFFISPFEPGLCLGGNLAPFWHLALSLCYYQIHHVHRHSQNHSPCFQRKEHLVWLNMFHGAHSSICPCNTPHISFLLHHPNCTPGQTSFLLKSFHVTPNLSISNHFSSFVQRMQKQKNYTLLPQSTFPQSWFKCKVDHSFYEFHERRKLLFWDML